MKVMNRTKMTENPEEMEETWIEVKRRTRTRQQEEVRKNRQMIQIFVKVDGSKMFPMIVSGS